MPRRQDVSETRKNQILDAAMAVFARSGFHEARMDDIVQESGLSKGTLYWYFKSKEEIITAISQRLFATDIEQVEGLLRAEGTVSERLQQLIHDRIQGLQDMSGMVAILFEFYAVALHQDGVRQFIKAYFQNFHELLVALIEQGIERKEFRPVDALAAATALDAIFEGLIVRWLIDPEAVQWASLGQAAIRLLLDGLKQE
ncbi:MAG TPA: TetR/AcrR family transcriptional regulator [Ktedonobacteraceae bacterium]|nr:TetR/AcrR family transcriptional regulator [Ktedonobacteraceae bacterium]